MPRGGAARRAEVDGARGCGAAGVLGGLFFFFFFFFGGIVFFFDFDFDGGRRALAGAALRAGGRGTAALRAVLSPEG